MNSVLIKNKKKLNKNDLQIVRSNMQMVSLNKTQFVGMNDKRFYFHYGIVSLPFEHFLSNKVREKKKKSIKQKYNTKYITKNMIF